MSTENKARVENKSAEFTRDADSGDTVPELPEDQFLQKLEENIFEFKLPADVYYCFFAMNFYGVWSKLGFFNKFLYTTFLFVTLLAQGIGITGIWWSELEGLFAWNNISLEFNDQVSNITLTIDSYGYSIDNNGSLVYGERRNNITLEKIEFENSFSAEFEIIEYSDSVTVMLKIIAMIVMISYFMDDILTHYKVLVMLAGPMKDKIEKHNYGKNSQILRSVPFLLHGISLMQITFSLYVMFTSATVIVGASTAITAFLSSLALLFIITVDNNMLSLLNTIMFMDSDYHSKALYIRLNINDELKKKLRRQHDSNNLVYLAVFLIIVYGIAAAVINIYV